MRPLILIASSVFALAVSSRTASACDEEVDDPEVCAEEVEAFDESFDEDVSFFERLELDIGNRMLRGLVIFRLDTFAVEFEEEDDFDDLEPDSNELPDEESDA